MTPCRDAKVCNKMATSKIDDHRLQSDYKFSIGLQNPKGKTLYTRYCVCVVKTHDTNDNVTTETQSTFNIAHMNTDTWLRSSYLLVRFLSSMIHTLHRMAQVCLVRASHVHTWSERISSTLSPPFSSSSSSLHSSSHFPALPLALLPLPWGAVVTLRTSPETRWTPLTTPTSQSQHWSDEMWKSKMAGSGGNKKR